LTTTIACYLQSEFHRFIKFERKLYRGVPGGRPRHTEFAALRLSVPGRNYNYEMGWVGLGWTVPGLPFRMCFEEQGKRERLELEEKWG